MSTYKNKHKVTENKESQIHLLRLANYSKGNGQNILRLSLQINLYITRKFKINILRSIMFNKLNTADSGAKEILNRDSNLQI